MIPLLNPQFAVKLPPLAERIQSFDWQDEATDAIVAGLIEDNGRLLRAGTGTGKMYMTMKAIRKIIEGGLTNCVGSINPFKVLWVTPKSVKHETQKVVHAYGLTPHVMVMSYSELKSSLGAFYIKWVKMPYSTNADGKTLYTEIPIWNLQTLPSLVICDECHVLKNPNSLQSLVIRALPEAVRVIFASATPFQRVVDATSMFETFRMRTKYNTLPAQKENLGKILSWIASPKSINEYSPSAVDRLRSTIKKYIVELKNVRFNHPSKTKCVTIQFKNASERDAYNKLVQDLIDNLNKRKGRDGEFSHIHFLVEMQKMQQGAELLRTNQMCERAVAKLPTKAVIIASNFVETIMDCYRRLQVEHNIPIERIALIKGGQDMEERAQMVADFQTGKRDILLFTMRSGGVGISLHHDRASTKPRYILLPPTWSAIDLVQALGRGHRLTSMSVTEQEILWYGGTIEDAVKLKVELKVKCLSKAVTAKEQFVDTFINELDKEVDAKKLAEELEEEQETIEATKHNSESDDLDSADDDLALTGEGLDSDDTDTEETAIEAEKQYAMAVY